VRAEHGLANVSGSANSTSSSVRRRWASDRTTMSRYRSPGWPDLGAGAPWPGTRKRAPLSTPAGMLTFTDFSHFPIESSVAPEGRVLNVTSRSPTMSAPRACARPRPRPRVNGPALPNRLANIVAQIAEAARLCAAAAAAEDLREGVRVKALGHAIRAHRGRPQPVVLASLLLVGEKRVRFVDFLEAFGLFLVPAGGVRVILLGQLAVRLLDHVAFASSETPKIL